MNLKSLVFLAVVGACTCAHIPSTLKKCHRKDGNFNECLTVAVQDAFVKSGNPVKEIGLQKFEPLEIPALVIGAGTGAVGFSQNYTNMKVSGFSKAKINKVDLDFEAKTLRILCEAPLARMDFTYEINGKILLLPVYGKGPGNIDLHELKLDAIFTLEEYEKKGEKHYRIVSIKLDLTPSKIHFHLENLFDGDKALGDNINQVMNDNWSEVFADVKKSYDDAFGQIFKALFDHVLSKVSIKELFGDA